MHIETPPRACLHTARSFNGSIPVTRAVVCLHCHEILVPKVAPHYKKLMAINFQNYEDEGADAN